MRSAQTSLPPALRLLPGIVVMVVLAAACSGSGAEAATDDVATTDDIVFDDPAEESAAAGSAEGDGSDDDQTLTGDDAALAFSQCMRDEGLDFPDIGVDAEGNPDLRGAFVESGIDPRGDEFRATLETCGPILQQAGFGGGGRAQLAENPEFQDALVEFSECLRDRGYDVGDIQFGAGPGPGQTPADGDAAGEGQRGQGQGQGGFGDRNARFADALGLDIDDPQVEADIDECGVVIDTAFANAGLAAPGQ